MNDDMNNLLAASQAINSAAGVISAAGASKAERKWGKEMYNLAVADQRQDTENARAWQEQMYNDYFSPKGMMQQMVAAGINPNDAAAALAGGASTMPAASVGNSAPSTPSLGSANALSNFLGGVTINPIQAEYMQAQTRQMNAAAKGQEIQNEFMPSEKSMSLREAETRIAQNKEMVNKMISESHLNDAQRRQVNELLPYMLTKSQEEINNLVKATKQLDEQIALIKEQERTERAKQRESASNVAVNEANIALTGATQSKVEQETETERQRTSSEAANRKLQQAVSNYRSMLLNNNIDPDKIGSSAAGRMYYDYKMVSVLSDITSQVRINSAEYKRKYNRARGAYKNRIDSIPGMNTWSW